MSETIAPQDAAKQKRLQRNTYKTAISLPVVVKTHVDQIRGATSFSGQIGHDISAYWAAIEYGMDSLKGKNYGFTAEEGEYLSEALRSRDWSKLKFDHKLFKKMVNEVKDGPPMKDGLSIGEIVKKMNGLDMIEFMAFVEWIDMANRHGWTHEQAGKAIASQDTKHPA